MSKRNLGYDHLLPKHQKKIVLCLAKNGAMTMSQTNKKLHGENTSTARAFHELESKEIVAASETQVYRGRKFSKYWLSNRGVAFALLNGANPESTKTNALRYSRDKMMGIFFEFRSVSPKMANVLDDAMLRDGKISPEELVDRSLSVGMSMKEADLQKFVDITKKSAEFEAALKTTLKNLSESLRVIEKLIGV